ncbi:MULTISPECIES: TonB-dependent receptor domain-containing protein [unclassified Phenylobacterium]|uniref:TonB-dependent receptor domain-containing protein n=1 Tax=unclassified Phenylobacterium TaxID=2640670 RepID=UPI00083A2938|nr:MULTISPECIES: TonB-dependent receptor [unclassified Phenylobacterium]
MRIVKLASVRGLVAACVFAAPGEALAQRVNDNAVAGADDAFGASIGNERVGLYSSSEVRGFSPITAGNIRLEGLYIDRPASFTDRLVESNVVRVGLAAQSYLFPAPTGVVDFRVRPAGDRRVVSVLAGYGPMGGGRLELDAQVPITETLSVAAGVAGFDDEYASGADAVFGSYAIAARWRPAADVLVLPFWSRVDAWDRETSPLYVAAPGTIPPRVARRRYVGPDWADYRNIATNYGVLGHARLPGGFDLAAGLFRSVNDTRENHAHLLRDVRPDGTARRRISRDPRQQLASTSGEVRVSRAFVTGDWAHRLHASVRGRKRDSRYGGGASVDYGATDVAEVLDVPEPAFALGARTRDKVGQWTGGLAYDLRWQNRGALTVGLQRTDYRKTVGRPDGAVAATEDPAWLYNAAASWTVTPRLALYGSVTRGLEESGIAPDSAANRTQALPAIITDQWDAGARWVLPQDMRLVTGVFDVTKPYFAPDEANVFRQLGSVRHRGVEISLTGSPVEGLTLVAGAVIMRPRVTGEPVAQGRIGRKPVGQTERVLTVSGTWALPVDGLSLTFAANHHGRRVADQLNRAHVPAATILDAGLRYRFDIAETPALLRFQVSNLTNEFDWKVVSSGAFELNAPRTATLFLTLDF